ncbi:MAG: protein arginine kinase activator [Verrucomicrobiales bacterium]|jgi:protein arginine kinase activator
MTCDLCDVKASVFLTQIVDGEMQKINLCEECAKAKGVTDPTGFALADLLLGLGADTEEEKSAATVTGDSLKEAAGALDDQTTCKSCGFTHAQFKKAGRLGCPKCYQIFGSGLETLLKAMHKGTHHIGKVPARHQALLGRHYELDELKEQLDDAVGREAFEDAASLRDKIHKIENELELLEAAQAENPSAEVGH